VPTLLDLEDANVMRICEKSQNLVRCDGYSLFYSYTLDGHLCENCCQ